MEKQSRNKAQMKCMKIKQRKKNETCEITAKEEKSTVDWMAGDFDEFRWTQ